MRSVPCQDRAVHDAIYWFGFVGAWLLFTGPVFQAGVELTAEQEAAERMRHIGRTAASVVPPISGWWWLLPPARLVLASRRREVLKREAVAGMEPEDLEGIRNYLAIARGWLYVAAGALLIALKETYELIEHYEWSDLAYWVLVVAMLLLVLGTIGGNERHKRSRPGRR